MLDSSPKPIAAFPVNQTGEATPPVFEQTAVQFFDGMRAPLFRYLSGFPLSFHDSEDVIQEIFLDLFQQWLRGKPVQRSHASLFRAAHNLALKRRIRVRKENDESEPLGTTEESALDPALNPEDRVAGGQSKDLLSR